MHESIKEIYTNVERIILNSITPFFGGKINIPYIKQIEYQIKQIISCTYPEYSFNFTLNWDAVNLSLIPKFSLSSIYFEIMSNENLKTHDFIESSFYKRESLVCQKCNIGILNYGRIIDGDYSCDEYIIKNIIE